MSNKTVRSLIIALIMPVISSTTTGKSLSSSENSGSVGWKPAGNKITTKWANEVDPKNPLPEYPRPQMVRKDWLNLNGLWDYAIVSKEAQMPQSYDGKILVPFAVESALSGVGKTVGKDNCLWYRTTFNVPSNWNGKKILLHFGAVDWQSTVWVNAKEMGTHKGGYDPFSFDITDALNKTGSQEIIVRVWDPTDEDNAAQPRGKQVVNPGGIFYTSVTGIWQTVWLEPVPKAYIKSYKIVPDIDNSVVRIKVDAENAIGCKIIATEKSDDAKSQSEGNIGEEFEIKISDPKLWSPDSPFLYDLQLILTDAGKKVIDKVDSYFAMRKSSLCKDETGVLRLCLNNKPIFQFGPLDQGWWPDGLYTAPTDQALKYDIEVLKQLGFNMLRKHVKYESYRYYYWCDKMGLMVWQDMPSSLYEREKYNQQQLEQIDRQWQLEYKRMIDTLHNHPSIVMWVTFNEGWGQYDTERLVKWTKQYDPSRLVNNASGWSDRKVGDVVDMHRYPDPGMPTLEENRAAVLGEFGGLGWPIQGHLWIESSSNWGYRSHQGQQQYENDYIGLITRLKPLKEKGLAAAVYTQTTDCEIEVNGLMTYDRKVIKLDPNQFKSLNLFYLPPKFTTTATGFLDEISVGLQIEDKDAVIRYTLDDSEPSEKSAEYKEPVKITKDTTVKARAFFKDGTKSAVISKTFKNYTGKTIPAVKPDIKNKGLKYEFYKGQWEKLPDFSGLTAVKTGTAKTFDLSCTDEKEYFALRFTGYINVTKTGLYTFYTDSDDGSRLCVAGKEILNNDGVHGMNEVAGEIALDAGWHKIELTFFQGWGGVGLNTFYEGPGISKMQIPQDVLGY
jgi:hypothetical protein